MFMNELRGKALFQYEEQRYMLTKLFVLGRPGSGKTTAINYIQAHAQHEGWLVTHFDDYDILRQMFFADTDHKRFRPAEHEGFDVLDFSVLEDALREMEEQVCKLIHGNTEKQIITLELARDDYSMAMRSFSPHFLQNAYFLFIEVDIETCICRLHERIAYKDNNTTNTHFVTENIMRSYYYKDNKQYMLKRFKHDFNIKNDIEIIDSSGPQTFFLERIQHFISLILGVGRE